MTNASQPQVHKSRNSCLTSSSHISSVSHPAASSSHAYTPDLLRIVDDRRLSLQDRRRRHVAVAIGYHCRTDRSRRPGQPPPAWAIDHNSASSDRSSRLVRSSSSSGTSARRDGGLLPALHQYNAYWNWNADVKLRIGLDMSWPPVPTGKRKQGPGSNRWNERSSACGRQCDDAITSTAIYIYISGEPKANRDDKKAGRVSIGERRLALWRVFLLCSRYGGGFLLALSIRWHG